MNSNSTIAILGDIHGCYNTLLKVFGQLSGIKEIYTVGDLIDRGKYSKEVVEFCMKNNIKPVKGNHEDMMIRAIDNSDKFFGFLFKDAELYYQNGGGETQYSYIRSRLFSNFTKFKQELKALGHYDYIKNFPLRYEFKKVIISHAGIIEGGNDISVLWNRSTPARLDKLQIFGHTPLKDFAYKRDYYSNIDTGCVYKNKLTAIIVDTDEGNIKEIIQEDCHPMDVE
ncbi:MAG: metallophosphoesterase [Bacteroidota bacterium]|nr:metallophosphoesterase [Bacteroidota bacterium]